jgi:hypothetical protein
MLFGFSLWFWFQAFILGTVIYFIFYRLPIIDRKHWNVKSMVYVKLVLKTETVNKFHAMSVDDVQINLKKDSIALVLLRAVRKTETEFEYFHGKLTDFTKAAIYLEHKVNNSWQPIMMNKGSQDSPLIATRDLSRTLMQATDEDDIKLLQQYDSSIHRLTVAFYPIEFYQSKQPFEIALV